MSVGEFVALKLCQFSMVEKMKEVFQCSTKVTIFFGLTVLSYSHHHEYRTNFELEEERVKCLFEKYHAVLLTGKLFSFKVKVSTEAHVSAGVRE